MKKSIKKNRVITKILKLDENNHYGYGMTKPLPTGCIKKTLTYIGGLFICCCKMLVFIIRLANFMWLILNLVILKPQKNKQFIVTFNLQLLKSKRLLIHAKGQYISCLNNILQQKRKIHNHTEQLKKLMQRYSKKNSTNVFRATSFCH